MTPNLLVFYGTNETWTVALATADLVERHPGTAGYLAPTVSVEIVDAEDRPLSPGAIGEVRIKSLGMIQGYFDHPQADARHFRDGWFYPGDAGVMTADGLLFLKGRTDEIMNFDGMLVSPEEIERVVLDYPAIAEATAFAMSSSSRGEVPFVAVVSAAAVDAQALLAHCRARLGSRAPLGVFEVKELPRNAMGKVLRRSLAEAARKWMQSDAG